MHCKMCFSQLALYRCVDIPKMLVELRSMRMGMVQTPEQLRFCFQAIILGKKRASMETPAVSPISERPKTLELVSSFWMPSLCRETRFYVLRWVGCRRFWEAILVENNPKNAKRIICAERGWEFGCTVTVIFTIFEVQVRKRWGKRYVW